jgi:hypothetical protein
MWEEGIKSKAIEMLSTYTSREVSEMMDIPRRTVRRWRSKLKHDYTIDRNPETIPIEELINERKIKFSRKQEYYNDSKLINVKVNIDGPIGIAHFGDPHIDDDGTDIEALIEHAELCEKTEGLFAGNVGDLQNNWIGRLAHLYGQQSTSAKESWILTEHFLNITPWLYLVGGNHDAWSGTGDPLDWIMRSNNGVYDQSQVRLNLIFPNKRKIRINCRHNWAGHSMWNTAHGLSRAVQMGFRDHIITAGHTHVSGYQVLKDPSSGLITHVLRIGSYKLLDRYAKEKGLMDSNIFQCPITIIDPQYEDNDKRLITTIFDPHEGAEYLTFKRKGV